MRYDRLFDSLLTQINLLLRLASCEHPVSLQLDSTASVCGTVLKEGKVWKVAVADSDDISALFQAL